MHVWVWSVFAGTALCAGAYCAYRFWRRVRAEDVVPSKPTYSGYMNYVRRRLRRREPEECWTALGLYSRDTIPVPGRLNTPLLKIRVHGTLRLDAPVTMKELVGVMGGVQCDVGNGGGLRVRLDEYISYAGINQDDFPIHIVDHTLRSNYSKRQFLHFLRRTKDVHLEYMATGMCVGPKRAMAYGTSPVIDTLLNGTRMWLFTTLPSAHQHANVTWTHTCVQTTGDTVRVSSQFTMWLHVNLDAENISVFRKHRATK